MNLTALGLILLQARESKRVNLGFNMIYFSFLFGCLSCSRNQCQPLIEVTDKPLDLKKNSNIIQ